MNLQTEFIPTAHLTWTGDTIYPYIYIYKESGAIHTHGPLQVRASGTMAAMVAMSYKQYGLNKQLRAWAAANMQKSDYPLPGQTMRGWNCAKRCQGELGHCALPSSPPMQPSLSVNTLGLEVMWVGRLYSCREGTGLGDA